jgi:hypothetical protein
MSSASLYRRVAATFIKCAKDSKTPSERDQLIAGAIHYQQLLHTFEDQREPGRITKKHPRQLAPCMTFSSPSLKLK